MQATISRINFLRSVQFFTASCERHACVGRLDACQPSFATTCGWSQIYMLLSGEDRPCGMRDGTSDTQARGTEIRPIMDLTDRIVGMRSDQGTSGHEPILTYLVFTAHTINLSCPPRSRALGDLHADICSVNPSQNDHTYAASCLSSTLQSFSARWQTI